ncbi:hypothetical protein [Pedobacter nanyangensis]|uniref:hypothetical protein n=1 Tax=Pedobacter nanyangensis TaxID=1562389 RepID=UPI0013B38CE7|nr:hypothetical protein [Pedobacter nanyangensis]
MKIFFLVVVMSGWTISGAAVDTHWQPLNKTATLQQQVNFADKPWRLKTFTAAPAIDWDMDGKVETDIFSKIEDCEKDDLLILRKGGTVIRDTGNKLCEDQDAGKQEAGTWAYDAAAKRLTLTENGRSQAYTVAEASAGKLVLVYKWKTTKGKSHEITAVYIR